MVVAGVVVVSPATHGSRSRAAVSLALLHCWITWCNNIKRTYEEAEELTLVQPSKTLAAWAETSINIFWSKQLSAVSVSMVGVMATRAGQTPLTTPPDFPKRLSCKGK